MRIILSQLSYNNNTAYFYIIEHFIEQHTAPHILNRIMVFGKQFSESTNGHNTGLENVLGTRNHLI